MRADARRNKESLRAAAVASFREMGLRASVTGIARLAGVSPGTLYNLYGSREGLIAAVVVAPAAGRIAEIIARADQLDPWEAFEYFVRSVSTLQVVEPDVGDILLLRCPSVPAAVELFESFQEAATRYVVHARAGGFLRPDFEPEDLLYAFAANATLARAIEATAPGAWQRGVRIFLDGVRMPIRGPLPPRALTRHQVIAVLDKLNAPA